MDLLVIPNINNDYKKERAKDELPQSAGGKTIMTTEPKFVPNEAIEITIDNNLKLKTRCQRSRLTPVLKKDSFLPEQVKSKESTLFTVIF